MLHDTFKYDANAQTDTFSVGAGLKVAFASFFGRLLTLLRIPSMITTAVLGISTMKICIFVQINKV